jgi:hypothetical protein
MVFFCDDTESHKIKQNSYPDVLFVTEATDLTTFPQMVQNMVEEQQNLIKLVWSSHSIEGNSIPISKNI